jgi:hypothetical protein
MKKFDNWGFDITEQLIEIADAWCTFKGYECIEEYGDVEVVPYEDAETQLGHLKGSIGYEPYYLYENLYYRHLREFTMTKKRFLDFFYNTGADGDQHQMRIDEGYRVVDALLDGKEYKIPTAESLFEGCGYFRMSYCEEVTEGHPLESCEDEDLDFEVIIKIVD